MSSGDQASKNYSSPRIELLRSPQLYINKCNFYCHAKNYIRNLIYNNLRYTKCKERGKRLQVQLIQGWRSPLLPWFSSPLPYPTISKPDCPQSSLLDHINSIYPSLSSLSVSSSKLMVYNN